MEEKPRKTGIDVIDATPWGTHLCLFYDTKQDLVDILVPYFKAGLENNEFCMWVTAEPLNEEQAKEAIRKAAPEFDQYLERGQIEIIPHTEWYLKDGAFNSQRVLNAWIDKLQQALARGYDGMRLTGNTSWLTEKDWRNFTSYEEEVNNVIGKSHMLAICAYSIGKCGAGEAVDVVSNHQSVLIKQAGDWALVGSPEYKQLKKVRQESEQRYRELFQGISEAVTVRGLDGKYMDCNEAALKMLGYTRREFLNLTPADVIHPDFHPLAKENLSRMLAGETIRVKSAHRSKDRKTIPIEITACSMEYAGKPAVIAMMHEIIKRKPAGKSQEPIVKTAVTRRLTSLQERFTRSGFDGFEERDVLELLLSLVLPSREYRKLAEELVNRFKNLRGLLTASPQELEQAGLTPSCMFCIKLLHKLPEEILKQKMIEQTVHSSSKEVFDYLYYSMRDLKNEVFKVIYLNNRNQIIDVIDLFEGTRDSIPIRPREIVESAIERSAPTLIFVHNHPSGDPTPSKSDKQLTRDLTFVGMILQIKVLDHIIIGGNRYFSFADEGLIQKYGDNFLNLKIRGVFDSGVNYSKGLNKVPALLHNR